MTYPDSTIVDESDNVIGQMQLYEAYRQEKIVRGAQVVLVNGKGEYLIQKRSQTVDSPGKWQESAGGHVDAGDGYIQAAHKELKEEIGVTGVELKELNYYFEEKLHGELRLRTWHKVFIGSYDGEFRLNSEVAEVRWISLGQLKEWVNEKPQDFLSNVPKIVELLDQTD